MITDEDTERLWANVPLDKQARSDSRQALKSALPMSPQLIPNKVLGVRKPSNLVGTYRLEIVEGQQPDGEYVVSFVSPSLSIDSTLTAQESYKLRQRLIGILLDTLGRSGN